MKYLEPDVVPISPLHTIAMPTLTLRACVLVIGALDEPTLVLSLQDAEEALGEGFAPFRDLFVNSPNGIWLIPHPDNP